MSERQRQLLDVVRDELHHCNASPKSIKAYRSSIRYVIRRVAPRHPREVMGKDIRGYLVHLLQKKLAASTVNQVVNALRVLSVEAYCETTQDLQT